MVGGYSYGYSYAANSNRLTSQADGSTYTYNADGSPTSYGGFNLAYGTFGRLARATSTDPFGPVLAYFHNGLGQRVLKTSRFYTNGVPLAAPPGAFSAAKTLNSAAATQASGFWTTTKTDRFFYDDQGHLLGEYDSTSGYSQETVWFNGQPVATVMGGKTYYVFADHLGTPRSAVRAADNVEVWRWDSDPFGNSQPSGQITYNLRFPGQYADSETGSNYNGMRDYDPWAGRYVQADPIGLGGGLSRYTYVGASPLNNTDPLGLLGMDSVAGAALGLLGGGFVNGFNYYSQGCSFSKGFLNGAIGGAIGGAVFTTSPMGGGALAGTITQSLNRMDGVSSFSNPVLDVAFAGTVGALTGWAGGVAGQAAAPQGPSWIEAALGALAGTTNGNTTNIWANVGGLINGNSPPPSCHK